MRDPNSASPNAQTPPGHPDAQVRVDQTSREFGVPERKLTPVAPERVTSFGVPEASTQDAPSDSAGEITLAHAVEIKEGETPDEALQRTLAEQAKGEQALSAELAAGDSETAPGNVARTEE